MMYNLRNLTHNGATTRNLLAHPRKCHHLILPDSLSDSLEPLQKKLLVQATTDDFGVDNSSSISCGPVRAEKILQLLVAWVTGNMRPASSAMAAIRLLVAKNVRT